MRVIVLGNFKQILKIIISQNILLIFKQFFYLWFWLSLQGQMYRLILQKAKTTLLMRCFMEAIDLKNSKKIWKKTNWSSALIENIELLRF